MKVIAGRIAFPAGLLSLLILAFYLAWVGRLLGHVESLVAPLALIAANIIWWSQKGGRDWVHLVPRKWQGGIRLPALSGLWLCLFLGLLPLVALWSGHYINWFTVYANFLGQPRSDSLGYLTGALVFIEGRELTEFPSRRPINALLLGVRYVMAGGRLEIAMVIQALMNGAALYLGVRAVREKFGWVGALYFFVLCYGFLRVFVPTTLSESLGLTLGLVAIPLLIDGVYRNSRWGLFGAATMLSVAQMVRPGVLFILPALLLWALLRFRKGWGTLARGTGIVIAGLLIGVLANQICDRWTDDSGQAHSNLSYTFYGLTIGGNWHDALVEITEHSDELVREGETTDEAMFRLGFKNLVTQPQVFAGTICRNMGYALLRIPLDIGDMIFGISVRQGGFSALSLIVMGLLCLVFFFPILQRGLCRIRTRDFPQGIFWLIIWLSMLAAFPLVIRDGATRVLAATFPLFGVFLAAVMSNGRTENRGEHRLSFPGKASLVCMGVLFVTLALGPYWARWKWQNPVSLSAEGEEILLHRKEMIASIVKGDDEIKPRSIAEAFRTRTFLWSRDDYAHSFLAGRLEPEDDLRSLEPPFTLITGAGNPDRHVGQFLSRGEIGPFSNSIYSVKHDGFLGNYRKVIEIEAVTID